MIFETNSLRYLEIIIVINRQKHNGQIPKVHVIESSSQLLKIIKQFIKDKTMAEESHIESFGEVQNQQLRLNAEAERDDNRFWTRIKRGQIIKISRKNILKGMFLLVVIMSTLWMASSFLNQTLIREKTPSKFGYSSSDVKQIAATNEVAYISFYYFQKMVEHAKNNVKNDRTYQIGEEQGNQYQNIKFHQLYGIFKVLKAIQLANDYEVVDYDEKEQIEQSRYQMIENLTAPVNLSHLFNKAADQAHCSSCYSFPITATIQYQYLKKYGVKVKLSEQELIDCSNPDQNANGCDYGNITQSFQYARDFGLVEEKEYPYRSQTGYSFKCNKKIIENQSINKIQIKGFKSLPAGDCKAIQYELVNGNVVAAVINSGRTNEIKNYSEPFRYCSKDQPNHAITVVGQTENQDWIIRNSWGQSWGDNGYYVIRKGNTCGICSTAFVPYFQGDEPKNDQIDKERM